LVRRLVESASYAVLLDAAGEFLNSCRSYPEVLIVAHRRGAADDLVRSHGGAGMLGVHRLTLTLLAVDLAQAPLARAGLSPLSRLGTEALAARVIHQLRGDAIPYFEPVAGTPGLARAVARSIAELRLNAVLPEQIAATGPSGCDLARMATRFEQELAARSVADFPLFVRHALTVAREGRHRLLGLPVVLLDLDLQAKLLRDLVDAVVARSPAVLDARLSTGSPTRSRNGRTLDRVRQSLFAEPGASEGALDESLAYFSAAGESLECVEIARRIGKYAARGVPFDRIAILLRSPERYQPLVEEALARAAIPAYFSRGVTKPDPAGRAFLALLGCAREGCSATRFAEYLSLGQVPPFDYPTATEAPVPLPPEDELLARLYERMPNAAPPDGEAEDPESDAAPVISGTLQSPAAWEKLLVDAAVIGGRERWARRLRGLEAEFRVRLADIAPQEDGRRRHLLREIELLTNLERFALPLIERLAGLPRQAVWGEWIAHLRDLAAAALRRPAPVLSLLDELQVMEEVGPVGLAEVCGILSDRLRFLRREPPGGRYGQVFVAGIDEVRGSLFDIVFLPGLCEGLFPVRAREDPILLDLYREMMRAGLPVQDDRVAGERRLLHMACAATRQCLVFSYPRVDSVESRPRVPSFYALEFLRAAYGRLPALAVFEEDARRGAPTRLDWPAPIDPRDAIDDAEFDLAVLYPTIGSPREDASAVGYYLIAANSYLAASLRRYARRERRAWFSADGLVDPDAATLSALATQRLRARCYSPSSLQHFAACPYRFLLHSIYGLHPREEKVALEQMDHLTRGALFHEVQCRLFRELQSAQLLPIRPPAAARVFEMASAVLDRVAADYQEKLAPAIPRVWQSEIEDLRADLRGWIQTVAAADSDWLPVHFEFSFGMPIDPSRDPASTTAEAALEGVRLRGAIDLVEKHALRGAFRITDHKTGKFPQPAPAYVGGGAYLQPLAYALAIENLLGAPVELGRLFYCTQSGGYQEIPFEVTRPRRAFFEKAMSLIDGEIARGFLPAAPKTGACASCDYRPLCGPNEERRTARKHPDALEALQQLRNMP
jgi:CRISPR/Cas system-associated exonuclease Cas4 (RecB family)